jgi:hypothetical protein
VAIERRNPVPKGRYWVDIIDTRTNPAARLYFSSWLLRNSKKVKVVKVENYGALYSGANRDWYLFDVLDPVTWETGKGFGLPTIVQSPENPNAPVVTKPEDTATKPPPPAGPLEQLETMFEDAKTVVLIGLALWLFTQSGKGRN